MNIKKHTTFEQEVAANEDVLQTLHQDAADLATADASFSDVINTKLARVDDQWSVLCQFVKSKGDKLKQAHQYSRFEFVVADLHEYIAQSSKTALSSDSGKDVDTCSILIKKFEAFTTDVDANYAHLENLKELSTSLVSSQHTRSVDIANKQKVCLWFKYKAYILLLP